MVQLLICDLENHRIIDTKGKLHPHMIQASIHFFLRLIDT